MAVQEIADTTWTSSTVNSQTVYTSASGEVMASTDNSFVSGDITSNISGKKILVDFEVLVAYANVAATLILEGSLDGTNWGLVDTLDSDTEPDGTGRQLYVADLTSHTSIPLFRLHFNVGGLTVGGSGRCKFRYSFTA
tara:strand:+ start:356 stop:769 length:414 start_codon:yes stop_codon:yes gene_type:complete